MPTFRDVGGDFFESAGFDFDLLNIAMADLNGVFYIKVHPNAGLDGFCLDHYDNIKVVPASADPYPLMPYVDVLITDYSSIYIDFLLLNKPIVFFAFDLQHYLASCRDMYFEYEEVTPGKRATCFKQLLTSLNEVDLFNNQRVALKEKFWGQNYTLGYKTIADELIKGNN